MPIEHVSTSECILPSDPRVRPSGKALTVLLLGGFITVFDLFVINVAAPSMQVDLNASFSEIGFVIAGYELAFGVLLIAAGRLGDAYGRRRLFTLGMLGFAITSFLCGITPNISTLIAARLLQGAAGAVLFPQVYALLQVMYDDAGRHRAFGFLGMTLGLAAITGQVLGGFLVENDILGLGWRVIFIVNLPIAFVAISSARIIPESRASTSLHVDWIGIAIATAGLLLLLYPLLEGPAAGWPLWTWGCIVFSVVILAIFVKWEHFVAMRNGNPAIDLALFKSKGFSLGSLVVLLIYSSSTSLFLCFALLMQSGLGLTPFESGTLFAPASLGFAAASLVAAKLVARWGDLSIAGGAILYAAGIGYLILTVFCIKQRVEISDFLAPLVLFGFGQGLSMTPLLNLVIGFSEEKYAGMAAGVISTMQQVGGAFGVSIVGIFFIRILEIDDKEGVNLAKRYAEAFSGAMVYNLIVVIVAAVLITLIARKKQTSNRSVD